MVYNFTYLIKLLGLIIAIMALSVFSNLAKAEFPGGGGGYYGVIEDFSGTFNAQMILSTETITAATQTVAATTIQVFCDSSSNAVEVDLPAAASSTGRVIAVKNVDNTNGCSIDPNGSEEIDGSATTLVVGVLENIEIISDGTAWWIR